MKGIRLIVLTNHEQHSAQNSLYILLQEFLKDIRVDSIKLVSQAFNENHSFFTGISKRIAYVPITADFGFDYLQAFNRKLLVEDQIENGDVIFLRLPPPADKAFFQFLASVFSPERIINNPLGILRTSPKSYLLHFKKLCPPLKICHTWQDVETFTQNFPIVLKPMNSYGGKGILKIYNDQVFSGTDVYPLDKMQSFIKASLPMVGMKYLKNVHRGDKRVIVVAKKIISAFLRVPAPGNWVANVAAGAVAQEVEVTEDEKEMARILAEKLEEEGIVIFGFDTLTNDDGRQILSEINTMSIGGFVGMKNAKGESDISEVINLLINYMQSVVDG